MKCWAGTVEARVRPIDLRARTLEAQARTVEVRARTIERARTLKARARTVKACMRTFEAQVRTRQSMSEDLLKQSEDCQSVKKNCQSTKERQSTIGCRVLYMYNELRQHCWYITRVRRQMRGFIQVGFYFEGEELYILCRKFDTKKCQKQSKFWNQEACTTIRKEKLNVRHPLHTGKH